MSQDWAQLKAKRAGKAGTARAVASSPSPAPSADRLDQSRIDLNGPEDAPSPMRLNYSHPDLPVSLAVHSIPGRGRGITAGRSFTPGSTLVSTTPLVSVLDNRNLSQRCSACYRTSDDNPTQKPLHQCSQCHTAQYCSPACQTYDWKLHKLECKALIQVAAIAKEKGKTKGRARFVPDTPVRAIGRLLWRSELEGEPFWKQLESLESHRGKLDPEEQERFFHLSIAVAGYVGQPTVAKSCPDSKSLIDLLSRFTSNSFSLTSPTDLTNIGVSISPLTALFNHSCRPNAVVVFPSFPAISSSSPPSSSSPASSTSLKHMKVIAISPIREGEEVVTSYVDLGLPRKDRRKELRERYKFECTCEECSRSATGKSVDPREAFECMKEGCRGLLAFVDGGGESTCSTCHGVFEVPDIKTNLDSAKSVFESAEKTQYTDPAASLINLSNLISSLTSPSSQQPRLSLASYPLFHTYSLLLSLQLDSQQFSLASKTILSTWQGAILLYPRGHPVRSILSTTLARLASIPPSSPSPEEDLKYWSNLKERKLGLALMIEALKECEIGFGGNGGGGEVGKKLRSLIKDQEEGIAMAVKVMRGT